MEELRENRNPFAITGFLGRKWYFILGIIIGIVNIVAQLVLCNHIFREIFTLARAEEPYCLYDILTSGIIVQGEIVAYVILFCAGIILSFINNKKRITDILGDEKYSYLLASVIALITGIEMFLPSTSVFFGILHIILLIMAYTLICYKGELSLKSTSEKVQPDSDGSVETLKVVSFWRRWLAYILDASFILGGISVFLIKIFPDFLISLGDFSILIGAAIFVLYFGIMNSEIGKGQTLGKAVLGVKVVDSSGNYITLKQSLLRAAILTFCLMIPFALMQMALVKDLTLIENIIYTLAITAEAFFCFMFLFNLKTRQTLHDLAAKTYVVTEKCDFPLKNSKINIAPLVCAIILALLTGFFKTAGTILMTVYKQNTAFASVQKAEQEFDIKITKKQKLFNHSKNKNAITVYIPSKDIYDADFADKIGQSILNSDPYNIYLVNVFLYKQASIGNMSMLKQQYYTVKNDEDEVDK